MRLPMGIVPPSSTILADPTACHCAETTRLYGPLAVEYARVQASASPGSRGPVGQYL
jgi:hypothetical protein